MQTGTSLRKRSRLRIATRQDDQWYRVMSCHYSSNPLQTEMGIAPNRLALTRLAPLELYRSPAAKSGGDRTGLEAQMSC